MSRFGASFQRFLYNFAAHGFGQVVNVLAQIVSVPAFLHYWTKTEYGEWLVLTSIPSLLWTLDNGLSGLAGNRMTVASGSGDWKTCNLIFHNVLVIQGVLSLVILLGAGVYMLFGDSAAAFGFHAHAIAAGGAAESLTRVEANRVLFIMIGYMLLGYCLGLLRAAYRASALEARGVAVANLARLTGDFLATILVLVLGGHALALACALLGSMAFWTFSSYLDVRRRCPHITFSFGPVSGPQFRRMMVDGIPVMANTAAGAFFLQGYPLIVNAVLGPIAVVTLTTIRTASRTLLQITGMVSNASSSEMARTYGARDWDGYLRLLKVLLAVTVWSALAVGAALTIVGPWVIGKWTLGRVLVDHQLLFFFAISVACQSCWSACGQILFSTNMHHAFNYANFALTVAGLAIADVVIRHLGFVGIPLVMMTVDAVLLALALVLCHRKLSFISLTSLLGVLNPMFYLRKLEFLLRAPAPADSRTGS